LRLNVSTITKLKSLAGRTLLARALYKLLMKRSVSSRTTYQSEFIEFVANRRGISIEKARASIEQAQKQFDGGWSGDAYRRFTDQALETFKPLYDDTTDSDVIATYKLHAPNDFLRMLGYAVPRDSEVEEIVRRLRGRSQVDIVDYGCGLAHRTIAVSRQLQTSGTKVKLYLVDIRKELHAAFLGFLCKKFAIEYEFLEVSPDNLYPELPAHDYCDNVSVLEHVRDPVRVIDNTHRALRPGGLFLAYVADQEEEMMHISPDLSAARRRLKELSYTPLAKVQGVPLFQKPRES
jgi:SAM-dependent methyltransferase